MGGARAGRHTCQPEEQRISEQPPSQERCRRSTVVGKHAACVCVWREGYNGWHLESDEGQQAIQLKGSGQQGHVSHIPPKSLQLHLKL